MKILVYDDNLEFGGHQVMACRGIEALIARGHQVAVIFNPENRELKKRLELIHSLEMHPVTGQILHQFKFISPDRVLCIQGDISQSIPGISAAKKAQIKCISYIAIAHPMSETGARLGSIRDGLTRRQINRADEYITISDSMKSMLIDRKTSTPIHVIHNGIPPPPIPTISTRGKTLTLGVIGRIEFKQKQQNFMVRAFQEQSELLKNCKLLIAGNGPDEKRLKHLIKGSKKISIIPWSDDIESLYDQIDLLVIPSRYEGVPLVLLEALARGIPVIASATDGMREILPNSWTFTTDSTASMAWALREVQQSWNTRLADLQQKIITDYSLEQFNRTFVKVVTGE